MNYSIRIWTSSMMGGLYRRPSFSSPSLHGGAILARRMHESAASDLPPRVATRVTTKGYYGTDRSRHRIIDEMIRVNHAGETGAVRICEGQLSVLRWTDPAAAAKVEEIYHQEIQHLKTFEKMIPDRRIRPTVLHPIWNVLGYALGVSTAVMGSRAAMACHEIVETAISSHYTDQLRSIHEAGISDDEELRTVIRTFRDDELHHREIGEQNGAHGAPLYPVLAAVIDSGCKVAIWLSKKI